ncbi:MAG: DUF2905 domain-containing protein [Candidatus Omnitrophota bacterium]
MSGAVSSMGKFLIVIGIMLVAIGALFIFMEKIPYIGKLPGDVYIKKKNVTFYFPITTSIIISIILSLVFFLFSRRH